MKLLYILLLCLLPGYTVASKQVHKRPRHVAIPGSMLLQTAEIERLQLPRIVDDRQLHDLEAQEELVRIPENEQIRLDPQLTEDRRYARPWARNFIYSLGRDFYSVFRSPVRVTSAIRTEEQQRSLQRYNRFAAAPSRSSHTTGITFDVSKRQLTPRQYRWMVGYLKKQMSEGWAEVSEEPQCFHIAVMERYNDFIVYRQVSVLK